MSLAGRILITGALLFFSVGAHAQERTTSSASAQEQAKKLFDEAQQQVDAGRPTVARDLLRRSLALYPTLPTRYNLGLTLRLTGETTEAMAMFDGLLAEPATKGAQRARIEEQLEGARKELATIAVRITGAERAVIEIDGGEVGEALSGAPAAFLVDAGEHVVLARAGGTTRQKVQVDRGKTVTVDLHVLSLAEQTAEERKSRRKRRATWITVGSVVVAAIVVGAVLAARPSGESPPRVSDDTPAVETTLRAR